MTLALILDTETTTNEATPERPLEVIELAYLTWGSDQSMAFNQQYKPTMPPTWGATAVHGILMSELEGRRPSSEVFADVPPADYWIGHNIDFDWKALGSPPVHRICTLAMARALWPEADAHNLSAITYFTQGATPQTRDKLRNAHSALADVRLCLELLDVICTHAKIDPTDLPRLYDFSELCRIPKLMTFGKHKGKRVDEVDKGYAAWYSRTEDPDPYLIVAFKRAGLLR